jgi:hypothetical protein
LIFVPGRRPNSTPIAKHFHSARPVSEKFVVNPKGNHRPKPRRILRLSFGALTPKEDRSIPELFNLIARGPLNCGFIFPDTGFITSPMPERFWALGRGRHIAFSDMTISELSGWFEYPMHNAYLHTWLPRAAVRCRAEPIADGCPYRFARVLGSIGHELVPFSVAIADKDRLKPFGYDHYVNMLSVRKRLGIAVARELQAKLGRDPTDLEVKQHVHNKYHPRLGDLAAKGWKDRGKRNYLADEELVVTAVLTAILSGVETLILTWDTDVFDQFTKLVEVLASDYICFRFSEAHYLNPAGCPMFSMEFQASEAREFGFREGALQYVLVPETECERLPPYSFTSVHAYCVLLGNNCLDPKISTAAFCLECEMASMLRVKGVMGGKNTLRFPGRNVIVGSRPADGEVQILFTLGEEKYMQYEGVTVSWFDLHHALKSDPLVSHRHYLA